MTKEKIDKIASDYLNDCESESDMLEIFAAVKEALEAQPCTDAISRSEAIRIASGYCHWSNIPEELAKLPSVNPKPCGDAISRQAAIDAMREETCGCCWDAKDILKHLPSVSTEKTGRWITKIKSDLRNDMWPTNPKCSECGEEPYYSNTIYNYKYCPYCGAKMVEPQESEGEVGKSE